MRVRMGTPGLAASPASRFSLTTTPAPGAAGVPPPPPPPAPPAAGPRPVHLLCGDQLLPEQLRGTLEVALRPGARGLRTPHRGARFLDLLGPGAGDQVVELGLGAGDGGARLADLPAAGR